MWTHFLTEFAKLNDDFALSFATEEDGGIGSNQVFKFVITSVNVQSEMFGVLLFFHCEKGGCSVLRTGL
jgi:hypothetical protein